MNKALTPAELADAQIAFVAAAVGSWPAAIPASRNKNGRWVYRGGEVLRGYPVGPGARFYRSSKAAKKYAARYLVPMGMPWQVPL